MTAPSGRQLTWPGKAQVLPALAMSLACSIAGAAGPSANSAERTWMVEVARTQPLQLTRRHLPVTADAPRPGQAMQPIQGVDSAGHLAVYIVSALLYKGYADQNRADQEREREMVIPTDQAVAGTAAAAAVGDRKKLPTQADADLVLSPYMEALQGTSLFDLLSAASAEMRKRQLILIETTSATASAMTAIRIGAAKIAFATDQRSIAVDLFVDFGAPGSAATLAGQQRVRVQVHSKAHDELDASEPWTRNNAAALRSTASSLAVVAIDVARRRQTDAAKEKPGTARTLRVRLGGDRLYLRGNVVAADCDYMAIDAVDGVISVVPTVAVRDDDVVPAGCARTP